MLEKVLYETKIDREDAIFIGDGERDLEASKRANIDYIMVHWGFSDYRDEEAVSSVEELYNRIVEA